VTPNAVEVEEEKVDADVECGKADVDVECGKAAANPANVPSGLPMSSSNVVLNGFRFPRVARGRERAVVVVALLVSLIENETGRTVVVGRALLWVRGASPRLRPALAGGASTARRAAAAGTTTAAQSWQWC
jgi:hypothetical protein